MKEQFTLVIHGGATNGTLETGRTPYMEEALRVGHDILANGGTAEDAVVAAVACMETSGQFNAGAGSRPNNDGVYEMDAAVMRGNGMVSGAVSNIQELKNPILAANMMMKQHGSHKTIASDDGVNKFLTYSHNLETITDPTNHFTNQPPKQIDSDAPSNTKGTVGAVAIDKHGHLASATSTGGASGKQLGRVGDTPIIGAGTYADKNIAISCTGIGENFIRVVAAKDVAARVEYGGQDLDTAANATLDKIAEVGGEMGWGGMIAIDKDGNVTTPFRCEGMYRGMINETGVPKTAIGANQTLDY